jgi:DNA-binding MarR family transcriptional regulator
MPVRQIELLLSISPTGGTSGPDLELTTGLSSSAVYRLGKSLIDKELVVQQPDHINAKAKRLFLSSKGKTVVEEVYTILKED